MKIILTLLCGLISTFAFAKSESTYTSVDQEDCLVINSSERMENPEVDFIEVECAAMGGYQVFVSGGDLRYNVGLFYQGLEIPTVGPMGFHDLASSKVEWRYSRQGEPGLEKIDYTAFIYRLSVQGYNEVKEDFEQQDMLIVVRLKGKESCTIGILTNVPDANVKAREIADDTNAKCLELSK